jgi:hypothetical protein
MNTQELTQAIRLQMQFVFYTGGRRCEQLYLYDQTCTLQLVFPYSCNSSSGQHGGRNPALGSEHAAFEFPGKDGLPVSGEADDVGVKLGPSSQPGAIARVGWFPA